jgi:shikimate kinase
VPLFYVTGTSGSGKSTVLEELKKHGFETHGVDEEGFADWVDRETGMIAPFSHEDLGLNIHDWYQKHRWVLSQERIGELKKQSDATGTCIFLGGIAEDENKVEHFFDRVIYLAVDEDTLKQRINNRKDNHFGKTAEEMAVILKWLKENDSKYRSSDALVIDATKPLDEVISNVLMVVKS